MITTPSPVAQNYAAFPASIHQLHHQINIAVDIIDVKALPLLVIVSRHLKYTTSMFTNIRKRSQLVMRITKVIQLYPR